MSIIPNILTIFRMIISPIMFLLTISQNSRLILIGFFLFICGVISDFLDGYLARQMTVSHFGKLWDPIADKTLTGLAIIALVIIDYLPFWIAIALILRDISVTYARVKVLFKGGAVILPMLSAKLKTTFEFILIIVLLFVFVSTKGTLPVWGNMVVIVYSIGLIILSWITGIKYLIVAHRELQRLQ